MVGQLEKRVYVQGRRLSLNQLVLDSLPSTITSCLESLKVLRGSRKMNEELPMEG